MTSAAAAFDTLDHLRVETIFARTYRFLTRQTGLYLLLVLVLGVSPNLLISWLSGLPLGELHAAPLSVRIGSMALFIVTDATMCALLVKATLDHLVGRPVSLSGALNIAPRQWLPLLAVTVALDAPMLTLNLISSQIAQGPALILALYGLRFAVGISLAALWCGATAIVLVDGVGPVTALARAARLTARHRWRVALFFAVFFLLKVLGPYLVLQGALAWLSPNSPAAGLISVLVWNYLACAVGVSTTLIYADLTRLNGARSIPYP